MGMSKGIIFTVCGAALVASSLVCSTAEHLSDSHALPTPSGGYPVGTAIFHLIRIPLQVNASAESSTHRELMVQVWYPAETPRDIATTPYIPDSALISAMKKDEYMNISAETLESWRNLKSHSFLNADVTANSDQFPLVIFSHGFGMARCNYTLYTEDLASHGFIVAAIDHANSGLTVLPDGRVLSFAPDSLGPDHKVVQMAEDATFVVDALLDGTQNVDKFVGRIDPQRIGMLGHSLGGAAALNVGWIDIRFRAYANLDGYQFGQIREKGINGPFLAILQQPGGPISIPDSMGIERKREWADIIAKTKNDAFIIKVKGTSHFNFSDFPFLIPDSLLVRNGGVIAAQRGHEIVTVLLRSFFAQYLDYGSTESFKDIMSKYPEVTFEVTND